MFIVSHTLGRLVVVIHLIYKLGPTKHVRKSKFGYHRKFLGSEEVDGLLPCYVLLICVLDSICKSFMLCAFPLPLVISQSDLGDDASFAAMVVEGLIHSVSIGPR